VTIGAGYALFTGVALEFLDGSGKSGSSRYAIVDSLGNLPVVYMTWLDGCGYAHWGPRGVPGMDVLVSAAIISILLGLLVSAGAGKSDCARALSYRIQAQHPGYLSASPTSIILDVLTNL